MTNSGSRIVDEHVLDFNREIWTAVWHNDLTNLRDLLKNSPKEAINHKHDSGKTALHTAAMLTHIDCAKLLLDHGADVHIDNIDRMTALHFASYSNLAGDPKFLSSKKKKQKEVRIRQVEMVKLLLSAGANPLKASVRGETAEYLAMENDMPDVANLLKEESVKFRLKQLELEHRNSYNALRNAAEKGDLVQFTNILRKDTKCLNERCPSTGQTLLYLASASGNFEIVSYIIAMGGKDITDNQSVAKTLTPLHIACQKGFTSIVRLLMEKQPLYVKYFDAEGRTPLHDACRYGYVDIVHFLLSCASPPEKLGPNSTELLNTVAGELHNISPSSIGKYINPINADRRLKQSPLHDAAESGNLQIIHLLLTFLEKGTVRNIDLKDNFGTAPRYESPRTLSPISSPLHHRRPDKQASFTSSNGRPLIAGIDSLNRAGYTPFHLAARKHHYTVCDELLSAGAHLNAIIRPDLNKETDVEYTMLVAAVNCNDLELIRYLLNRGATDDRNRALRRTLRHGFVEAAGLLLSYSQGVQMTPNDQSSDYYSSEKESHLLEIVWQHKELDLVHPEWIHSVLKENMKPPISSVLITLDVSRNKLAALPYEIFELSNLIEFDASVNQLTSLPSSPSMQQQKLVSSQDGTVVEEGRWSCTRLRKLNISKNQLTELPSHIFNLPSLEELRATDNSISSLPVRMWSSPRISNIYLDNNKISQLPHPTPLNLSEESNLEGSVRGDKVVLSPSPQHTPLQAQTSNSITNSAVTSFSESYNSYGPPITIEHIGMRFSTTKTERWLSTLPAANKKGQFLATIDRKQHQRRVQSRKSLLEDPDSTELDIPQKSRGSKESSLVSLSLNYNTLDYLPPALACYAPTLKKLYIAHNNIKQLGVVHDFPPNLEILDASSNQLTECITASLSSGTYKDHACYSPHSQTVTVLDDQELICPHRIHKTLRKISTLKLSHNNLTAIILFRLPLKQNSVALDKSHEDTNEGGSATDAYSYGTVGSYGKNSHGSGSSGGSGPGAHHQLKNSRDSGFSVSTSVTRDLKDQSSREFTEVAPPLYPELSNLDISHNKLAMIPPEISQIHTLGSLNVSCNELVETLPLELCRLENLFQLDYSGLELIRPNVSDLDKFHRTTDKLNFMRALMEDSAKNYKMKLMLVGLQKQGKTTLLNRLREVSEKGSIYNPTWGERTNSLYYSLTPPDSGAGCKEQLSTVGVDLGEWRYSKDLAEGALVTFKNKLGKATKVNPTITFYTWDFAGQEEYYATHQCFLTYRSLYLLLWNAHDDKNGIRNLSFWLNNIQSRAPGSPVIVIGTHLDKLGNTPQDRDEKKARLERIIKEMYLVGRPLHELEEHGLPVIKDVFFVGMPHGRSDGIQELRKQIYDIAMMLSPNERRGRVGKSGEQKLLDQPVPAKYIKLEECVHQLRRYCRDSSKTPVMNVQEFRENMRDIITDPADLQHAVTYLHENGVLLHYNTPTLEHLYFVDPQWLVDMLAHIVTVPEVNRYIKRGCHQSGILRVTNMSHIFRGQVFPSTYQSEYIELLGRFEVALALNSEQLLIPSFLPDTPRYTIHWYRTKFPRPPIKDVVQDYLMDEHHTIPTITSNDPIHEIPHSSLFDQSSGSNSSTDTPALRKDSSQTPVVTDVAPKLKYTGLLLRRLYFMLYMPSGFWPRLISRMVSNNSILELIRELLGHSMDDSCEELDANINRYETGTRSFMTVVGHSKLNWSYWKTGIELWIEGKSVFRVSEILGPDFYQQCSGSPTEVLEDVAEKAKPRKYEIPTISYNSARQEHFKTGVGPIDPHSDTSSLMFVFGGLYNTVNTLKRKGLEILIPDMICLSNPRDTSQEGAWTSAKLLSRLVDFIDALLEDWFPGLGARNLLPDDTLPKVVRLVPCPLCIGLGQGSHIENKSRKDNSGFKKKYSGSSKRVIKKEERVQTAIMMPSPKANSHAFLVEELVYTSKTSQCIECPNHKKMSIADLAPDLVFADIQYMVLNPSCVDRNKYIDSGGFGDIFYGFLFRNPTSDVTSGDPGEEVAIKVQSNSEMKGDNKNDDRHICMGGYLSMRAELSILESLDHPHIIRVLGLLLTPYSMLVEWAPLGSLHSILTTYWENNLSIQPHVLHKTVTQVADGLAYLHKKEIIYYDLKSPNILAFNFPKVQLLKSLHSGKQPTLDGDRNMPTFNTQDDEKIPVLVKVADMGISRYSVLGKSKGFRGTPGFMAPEILKFHGAETCDCKVDVFSMGMFLYELVAGHFPYEYQNLMDGQIEKLIVSGERPPLQKREITNPFFYLNCMRWCWQDDPRSRPTSLRLADVLRNPSLPRLIDSFPLGISNPVSAVCLCQLPQSLQNLTLSSGDFSEPRSPERKSSFSPQQGEMREEIWICFKNERMGQATVVSFQEHSSLNIETVYLCQSRVKCLCAVKDTVWVCSEGGDLYVYQASTHKQLFERTLVIPGYEVDCENEITSIVYYPALSTVVVSTFSGAILCFEDQPSDVEERDCEGFSENSKCFLPVKNVVKLHYYVNTVIAIPTKDDDTFQVWCGCLGSIVAVLNVKEHTFSAPDYLMSPFSKGDTPEEGYIHHLAHTLSYSRQRHVWSLLNPSSILQCWDAEERKPIPEKEYRFCDHKEDPVQSMLAFEEYIYLGTLNGRIYIFDTQSCKIKCELQGHDKTVYSLTRMNGVVQPGYWMPRILGKTIPRQRETSYKKLNRVQRHKPVIVSIGTGFKDITDRPLSSSSSEDDSRDTFMLAWLGEYSIGHD